MPRVMVIVEGQTEESFVERLLNPAFNARNIFFLPRLIGKPGHRGGIGEYQRARIDILTTLKQERETYCTTMFDYYGMPDSWPGVTQASGKPVSAIPKIIENAILADISHELGHSFNPARLIPYVQMHEYEALLFSEPKTLAEAVNLPHLASAFQRIRDAFPTPEDIDDSPDTAPSKRIVRYCKVYDKVLHGTVAASKIGLNTMRTQCKHFNDWLTQLESLPEPRILPGS